MRFKKIIVILTSFLLIFTTSACSVKPDVDPNGGTTVEKPDDSNTTPNNPSNGNNTPDNGGNINFPGIGGDWGNVPGMGGNNNPGMGGDWGNTPGIGGNDNPGTSGGTTGGSTNNGDYSTYSTLPVISVTTAMNGNVHQSINSLEDYTTCTISVTNCDEGYEIAEADAGIRLRGNSTANFSKKPYKIKFEQKQSILGMNDGNKYKSWVLLADWNDSSYSRNYFSLNLAEMMDGIEYSADCRHVELYLNGEYNGVYLMCEQVQVGKNRVDIDESGVKDGSIVDTGYLLELEASTQRRQREGVEGEAWFKLDEYAKTDPINDSYKVTNSSVAYYVIKSDARSKEQVAYIKDYMTQVYTAIYKTKNRETIESLIDINSAIDMYIIQMMANDIDGNYSSIYVYKDKGGKLKFGPVWDFDNCYMNNTNSTTFYHLLNDLYNNYSWFSTQVKAKIQEYFKKGGIVEQAFEKARTEIATHKDAINNREYRKWRVSQSGTSFGGQYNSVEDALNSFESWLKSHKSWISSKYNIRFDD